DADDPAPRHLFTVVLNLVDRLIDRTRGTISTWLVAPDPLCAEAEGYRSAIDRWRGGGADIEVVANLAYALWRFDARYWGGWAEAAARWVSSQQRPDGSWGSSWYCVCAYSTYVATRLVGALAPKDGALV